MFTLSFKEDCSSADNENLHNKIFSSIFQESTKIVAKFQFDLTKF